MPDDLAHALAGLHPLDHSFTSIVSHSAIAAISPKVTGLRGGRIRYYPVSSGETPFAADKICVTERPQ